MKTTITVHTLSKVAQQIIEFCGNPQKVGFQIFEGDLIDNRPSDLRKNDELNTEKIVFIEENNDEVIKLTIDGDDYIAKPGDCIIKDIHHPDFLFLEKETRNGQRLFVFQKLN